MVAAIVASLALAWGLGEVTGYKRSLEHHPLQAKWFYSVYTLCVVGGAALVGFYPNLISLNVGVQVMNALLLPLVMGFLVRLAMVTLPEAHRLKGRYLAVVIVISVITCAFGVLGGIGGLIWS
jgi:Mn2+/Fe2+ NRAMP family transporter